MSKKKKMEIKDQKEKGNNDILLPKLSWPTAKGANNFCPGGFLISYM